MAVRAAMAEEMADLDAAEDEYHRQANEDEEEIDSYAEMLQMWKGSKPGCWSTVSETQDV